MKHSSCCGAAIHHDIEDFQRCPECKENCGFAEDEENESYLEYVTIILPKFRWDSVVSYFQWLANIDYTVKEVSIKDGFFENDMKHAELKKASNKAYKELKNYEYDKRNK